MAQTGDATRRAFIAVHVRPMPDLLAVLRDLRTLGQAVKPVAPENLHITLRFLGPVAQARCGALLQAMEHAATGIAAFDLDIEGLGAFPDLNRPTVLWAGVHDDGPMQRVVRALETPLAALDFPPEDRPFHGHLTLARIKRRLPAPFADIYSQYAKHRFGDSRVKELLLMHSDLTPSGPVYDVLGSVRLKG